MRGAAAAAALVGFAIGAPGCDTRSEARPQPGASADAKKPPASAAAPSGGGVAAPASGASGDVTIPGADLAALDEGQKRWLRELLEQYPSPCGRPHSLATSLKTDPKCRRSVFAARYFVTLLKAGLMKSEAEEHYEKRFVSPERGECRDLHDTALRGSPGAPVTLCEFSDFQCPHCKLMEPILARLLDEYRDQVKLYYKNYPISKLHPEAREAAAAAVAAGRQGKFWQMHDKLFNNQEHLGPADLERYAADLKLDVKRWKADLSPALDKVAKEHGEGEKLDITGTPTLYINGRKYAGPLRYEDVKDWVDEELSR